MPTPQKVPCAVSEIVSHGNQVYTVELTSESVFPRFNCGQFLHLTLDEYDPSSFWPESRVFSIASSPADRNRLKITYSVKGKYTSRMKNELTPGKEVWIKMPYGDFYIDASQPVVLIAGGTGITAFSAFLEDEKNKFIAPFTIFYGAKERNLLIYKESLDRWHLNHPDQKVFYFLEEVDHLESNEIKGRINLDEIWNHLPEPLINHFYLSGPPPMLKAFSEALQTRGLPAAMIHIDAWE